MSAGDYVYTPADTSARDEMVEYRVKEIAGKLVAARIEAERLVLDLAPTGVPDDIRALLDQVMKAQQANARVRAARS